MYKNLTKPMHVYATIDSFTGNRRVRELTSSRLISIAIRKVKKVAGFHKIECLATTVITYSYDNTHCLFGVALTLHAAVHSAIDRIVTETQQCFIDDSLMTILLR